MEDAELVYRTCVVCGKTFSEIKHPKGNKRKTCSEECKAIRNRNNRLEYFRNRYHNDDEFREKIKTSSVKFMVDKRKKNKADAYDTAIKQLLEAETEEEIRAIIDKKFNMKSEVYDKNARTLRVSKESRR